MGRESREKWRALRWRVAMFFAPWDDPSEDPHETVDADGIPVDRGVVSLVRWCWSNGIETHGSCEGAPELWDIVQPARSTAGNGFDAYVAVETADDARRIAQHIQPFCAAFPRVESYEDGSVYWFVSFDPRAVSRWESELVAPSAHVVELRDTCAPRTAERQTA